MKRWGRSTYEIRWQMKGKKGYRRLPSLVQGNSRGSIAICAFFACQGDVTGPGLPRRDLLAAFMGASRIS